MSHITPSDTLKAQVERETPSNTPPAPYDKEPESFIVQNITPCPIYVSDIKLTFPPFGVIDLTWDDERFIRRSTNLRDALRDGYLRRITPERWEQIRDAQAEKERQKAAIALQQRQRYIQAMALGIPYQAEDVALNAVDGRALENETSTAGYVNDAATYAAAYRVAEQQAQANGLNLDAAEYGEWVMKNAAQRGNALGAPNVGFNNWSVSGDPRRNVRAFVATQDGGFGTGTTVAPRMMQNTIYGNNDPFGQFPGPGPAPVTGGYPQGNPMQGAPDFGYGAYPGSYPGGVPGAFPGGDQMPFINPLPYQDQPPIAESLDIGADLGNDGQGGFHRAG